MTMLLLATCTDMFEAMQKANVETTKITLVLMAFHTKHDLPGLSVQLKTLWIQHVCQKWQEDAATDAPVVPQTSGQSQSCGAMIGKAITRPGTPQR